VLRVKRVSVMSTVNAVLSCPGERRHTRWRRASLSRIGEVVPAVEAVVAAMAAEGYAERDLFTTRLALEEAVVNGVKHGNRGDPSRHVSVRYRVGPDGVLVEVEDQGPGFDPGGVPDPTAPENLGRPCGRGLLLMRSYVDWVRHNARGNCVALCKYRTPRRDGA
jgi:serine/threonine-protein kinase RsbW